jgi:predicted transcriptional regulator
MTISEYIAYNKERGQVPCSISSFARLMGVSRQTIYNWMNGRFHPHFNHIMHLVQMSDGKITCLWSDDVIDLKIRNMFRVARDFYENWDDGQSTIIVMSPEDFDV